MTDNRGSIFGRITGRLGFRFVSQDDFQLLSTVKRELLPGGATSRDNFIPRNMLGHDGFDLDQEAQLSILDSLATPETQLLFTLLRKNREINTGFMGQDYSSRDLIHNGFFPSPDAELYAAMIARIQPDNIIEIGSGYSTVVARTTVDHLGLDSQISVFDPKPRRNVTEYADHIEYSPVELSSLEKHGIPGNTLLFIDSSHVCRSGGDLPFLYCRLLPGLPPNVLVHIHDIFTPYDYPDNYHSRFYTEEYLLSALLAHSKRFEIVFATHFMVREHVNAMRKVFGDGIGSDPLFYGSSFYIQSKA